MAIRVHEIARKIGMDNRDLLILLQQRGYSVTSPSSTVDDITGQSLIDEFEVIDLTRPIDVVSRSREVVQQVTDRDRLIFVITAFGDDMEYAFQAISAAAESVGLVAKRVSDVEGDYRITDKILEMIEDSRFVVADLSRERPNVYFELGYARGKNKRVVTIVRKGTTVHFDVKDWKYLEYSDSRGLEESLKRRFVHELYAAEGEGLTRRYRQPR